MELPAKGISVPCNIPIAQIDSFLKTLSLLQMVNTLGGLKFQKWTSLQFRRYGTYLYL